MDKRTLGDKRRKLSMTKGTIAMFELSKAAKDAKLPSNKECNSLSFDAVTAHTAIIFARYMMLSVENRESKEKRSLGEIFMLFREQLTENIGLSKSNVLEVMDAFMKLIPSFIKERLQTA